MVHVLAWGSFLFKEINADDHPRREVYYGRSREGWMRPREMGIESGLWQPIGMGMVRMVPRCIDLSLGLRKPYESAGRPTAKEFLTRENRVKVLLVRSDAKMSPERELMNLNETGCKARIPVAILYGACGPA